MPTVRSADKLSMGRRITSGSIGEYFRELRVRAGRTQLEASKFLGQRNSQIISAIERGRVFPTFEVSVRLCDFYGGKLNELQKFLVRKERVEKTKIRHQAPKSWPPSSVNQFLRDLRVKAGKSQLDAALFLKQGSAQYISNLEREVCDPSLEMAIRLCEFYGGNRKALQKLMFDVYRMELDKRFGKKFSRGYEE